MRLLFFCFVFHRPDAAIWHQYVQLQYQRQNGMPARFPQSPHIIKEMVCEFRKQHYDRSSKMVQINNSVQPTEAERTLGGICLTGQPSHPNALKGCRLMVLKAVFLLWSTLVSNQLQSVPFPGVATGTAFHQPKKFHL